MRRTFIVEFDDQDLQRRLARNLKWVFVNIADQLFWGDTSRSIIDRDGNVIGQWRQVETAEEHAG